MLLELDRVDKIFGGLHAVRDGIRIAAVLLRELTDQHINGRSIARR